MQRVLRDLEKLPPLGRRRVVTYWASRIDQLPVRTTDGHGEQQLDLEDAFIQLQQAVQQ
jgi:hypothetical protein